jgi:hypothetical protein
VFDAEEFFYDGCKEKRSDGNEEILWTFSDSRFGCLLIELAPL